MSDLIPLTQMLATGVPAFVVGVLVGRFQERHKEKITMRDFANTYRVWYDRWAPVVVTAVAILAVVGIWMGTAATITNAAQDRRADAASRAVQKCFDDYAIAQSASSKAVREASVVKDEATKVFNQALNDEGRAFKALVRRILADEVEPSDVHRLYRTLARRDRSGRAVERAQVALDKARADNPVPSAPSEFCRVKP